MISHYLKGKTYIFIDAENLFYAQRTLGWKISYEKLFNYFRKECGPGVKCFIYSGKDEDNAKQLKFLDMLEINGYVVRTRPIKKIKSRDGDYKWKNNLDIQLAFEMVDTQNEYEAAVLISGDSDFAIPIDKIKSNSKLIIVMSTRGHIAKELLERAKYIDLRKLRSEICQ